MHARVSESVNKNIFQLNKYFKIEYGHVLTNVCLEFVKFLNLANDFRSNLGVI
jgi:hypothetical protein